MRNHAAYGFALLLLVQAMTAAITVVPSEQKQEELETPFVERSSGSNNSSSPCGSNFNYTNVYAYAPYMVMENQSFTTSSYVYCEILSANMMLDYSIVNANNSTVYSGNHSWTGSNVSSSNYTWNVSGLSSGYYTFHADLYVNGTFVDTDYDLFTVYANSSSGGGSGGGNYTSPCGNNANYSYVYAYAPYMPIENQSFTTSSYVYCEILGANMMLDYSIVDSSNSTVYSGNHSWTGSNASSSNYTWNVSGLSPGYHVFYADLYVNGTYVDTDYDSLMVYANTSGGGGSGGSGNYTSPCGNNANYSYVYAYAPYMLMENQSFTTSSYVYCEILGANMMLEYSIVDSNNSTVYSGNQSWSGTNSSGLNYTWNVSGLSAGYYTFHADLYINGTFVDTDYDSFMVYANTSGGGGGGGNYTSPCGNDANYSYVYAYAPYMLIENQPFSTTSYVYCEILNANMMLDFSIVDSSNSTVYSGNLSWTGTNASSSNYTWNVPGLSAGYHIFYADLYVNGAYVDTDYDPFMVYANSSGGGNNTGGNNTGGNNTDGNNTGGNNTDNNTGNNTGGNNTGGNNTGGNNTGDNTGNNTGNNTSGNNTGDNTGNNTGDNSGNNTDDSSTSDNTDNSTDDNNTGDNTGNSTDDSSTSDNTDNSTDDSSTSDNTDNNTGDNTGNNNTDGNNTLLDTDGDGIDDATDNCQFVANPDQADTDGNGVGTACDVDEILSSEDTGALPSISLLATSLCLLGAAILFRRD